MAKRDRIDYLSAIFDLGVIADFSYFLDRQLKFNRNRKKPICSMFRLYKMYFSDLGVKLDNTRFDSSVLSKDFNLVDFKFIDYSSRLCSIISPSHIKNLKAKDKRFFQGLKCAFHLIDDESLGCNFPLVGD